ncbi:hypothetical protein GF340_03940 [Candidatus Peregrinibacteria bacterium]|nr:hypothetical protein [Candidatus Peregrinibacteria bacterium]
MNSQSNCTICLNPLIGKQKMFCSLKCKNVAHQSYQSQKARGLKRKIALVKLAGGRCSMCGYNKNYSALIFHHKGGKDFKLDIRSLSNRTWQKVVSEYSKCVLLCHNCHSELHNPEMDLESASLSRLL